MKNSKDLFFLFLLPLLFCLNLNAQQTADTSLKKLSFTNFIKQVLTYHPFVSRTNALSDQANAMLMEVRGNLDPTLAYNASQKKLNDKEYYTYQNGGLKIPTWFGPDFKLEYDNNSGLLLDPTDFTPGAGLLTAGVAIPIGQGLFIDQRRAAIKQAKAFQQLTAADQVALLNKFILQATKDYWDWYFNYQQMLLLENGYNLADTRFKAVQQLVKFGDEAPIDSVEAKIELQNREVNYNSAKIDYINSSFKLNTYLWADNFTPLDLTDKTIPSDDGTNAIVVNQDSLRTYLNAAAAAHPDIQKTLFKLEQLTIERSLYKELLKPRLNLNLGYLQPNSVLSDFSKAQPLESNYKAGLDFYVPLFLRKERGKLAQAKIKIMQTEMDLNLVRRDVSTTISAAYNELVTLQNLLPTQKANVENYVMLRDAEQRKFENGESSLFLINTREQKLIESQVKLQKLKAAVAKAKINLRFAVGKIVVE